ncbi:MAG TPA: ornithine carbamoyltransferase [Bacillales bacterium]|nr:ornithine carbamoyltransferase [Bacillales bacterium]
MNLSGKDLLTLADYSSGEIYGLLELAEQLKKESYSPLLIGKSLGMIFEKPSTRTRVSFEVAMTQLGGHALYLNPADLQLGRGETISDTAKVLSRYVDAIMIRTFEQEKVEQLAEGADVPVINGLTNDYHPCQVLADLLTIKEKFGTIAGKTLAYIGDCNNMTHSLMIGAAKVGMNVTIVSPQGCEPSQKIFGDAKQTAAGTGAAITLTNDPVEAVETADVIYTDVWTSMGDEETSERIEKLEPFQVNAKLWAHAKKSPIFMHCLPAHRGQEVSAEIIDGPNSVVFDQAENRLHAQKALLTALIG